MFKKILVLSILAAMQLPGAILTYETQGTFGPWSGLPGEDPPVPDLPFTGDIFVDAFDARLGRLLGITVTLEGNATDVEFTLTNEHPTSPANLFRDAYGGSLMTLYAPLAPGNNLDLAVVFPALDILKQTIEGGDSASVGPQAASDSETNALATNWSYFTRPTACPDCIQLAIDGQQWFDMAWSGGTLRQEVSGTWNATAKVVYTYDDTPVPEPAMLTLVGGGLLSLGFFARRRRTA